MLDISKLIELAEKATPTEKAERMRYPHGGGRLALMEPERHLLGDFFDEANREYYFAMNPQTALALLRELAAARKFKEYVHRRLDDAGVPVDPPSVHREQGCRIGGRLDWVLDQARGAGVES